MLIILSLVFKNKQNNRFFLLQDNQKTNAIPAIHYFVKFLQIAIGVFIEGSQILINKN